MNKFYITHKKSTKVSKSFVETRRRVTKSYNSRVPKIEPTRLWTSKLQEWLNQIRLEFQILKNKKYHKSRNNGP